MLSIALDRSQGCTVAIHAFETTPEIDARGCYVHVKHTVVTFHLEGFPKEHGIRNIKLANFNEQNALSSVRVEKNAAGYRLVLEGCYGVDGSIVAERMSVSLVAANTTGQHL